MQSSHGIKYSHKAKDHQLYNQVKNEPEIAKKTRYPVEFVHNFDPSQLINYVPVNNFQEVMNLRL